jgi:hypothetical protein
VTPSDASGSRPTDALETIGVRAIADLLLIDDNPLTDIDVLTDRQTNPGHAKDDGVLKNTV